MGSAVVVVVVVVAVVAVVVVVDAAVVDVDPEDVESDVSGVVVLGVGVTSKLFRDSANASTVASALE